jgi:hypothetical protein
MVGKTRRLAAIRLAIVFAMNLRHSTATILLPTRGCSPCAPTLLTHLTEGTFANLLVSPSWSFWW